MKLSFDIDGWLKSSNNIKKLKSPNFDLRPKKTKIDLAVLHNISWPKGDFEGNEVEKLFLNKIDVSLKKNKFLSGLKVSSHFYIKRSGILVQFVSVYNRAWHAGVSKFLDNENCNDFSIGIELEGTDDEEFCEEQYITLFKLLFDLVVFLPSLKFITGHSYIAPKRKTDPGPFFDWDRLSIEIKKNKKKLKIFR